MNRIISIFFLHRIKSRLYYQLREADTGQTDKKNEQMIPKGSQSHSQWSMEHSIEQKDAMVNMKSHIRDRTTNVRNIRIFISSLTCSIKINSNYKIMKMYKNFPSFLWTGISDWFFFCLIILFYIICMGRIEFPGIIGIDPRILTDIVLLLCHC